MMQIFSNRTIQAIAFLSFCLLLPGIFGCQQDTKTVAPAATETTTAAPVTRETAPPAEDYAAAIMDAAKKEYEPLGRKILANREKLNAMKAAKESSGEIRDAGKAKDQEKRQVQVEAGFVENMKMLDYLVEKQNSGEMSKTELATEKKQVLDKIKSLESATTEIEKMLKSENK